MSALQEAMSQAVLGWVKPELDETLRLARQEIEAFAENPEDGSRMRFCAGYLHEVQGSLRMVELYAPAMVAEELELLAEVLEAGTAQDRDEACATLMRGMVLLPDYLERLQSGHRDIPIVLLPLLNEIRAARGAPGISESVLFAPDLDRPLPETLPTPFGVPTIERESRQAQAHAHLERALAGWPEDGAPADPADLSSALGELLAATDALPLRRMLWVASAAAEAIGAGALPASEALRGHFAGVGRATRPSLPGGESGPGASPQEITRQFLYQISRSPAQHPSLDALREAFQLEAAAPSEAEIDHARSSISGRNRALLDTVGGAIKEELLRVKDALDLHLRTGAPVTALQAQVGELAGVADTLGMMGLGMARTVVMQQRDALDELVRGVRPADENALLDIAGALLYVDATLDDQVANLGAGDVAQAEDPRVLESRRTVEALAQEAIRNFAAAREGFVAFIETNWDHTELSEVPRLLDEVSGALRMLDMEQAGDYVEGVRRYVATELIDKRRVPGGPQLDTLADAMASLEYFLEALRDRRPNVDEILDITRSSLESLHYWPLPQGGAEIVVADAPPVVVEDEVEVEVEAGTGDEVEAAEETSTISLEPLQFEDDALRMPTSEPAADTRLSLDDAASEEDFATVADVAVEAPAPVVEEASAPAVGGFDFSNGDVDDEIRAVFLEEFDEELDNLGQLVPLWREAPEDMERLRTIRRVFHTLKGSGRLVGAVALGEFSWKVENMLNRVLDGTRPPSAAVVAVVDKATEVLPELNAALRGQGAVESDLPALQDLADQVAAGEDVYYTPAMAVLDKAAEEAMEQAQEADALSAAGFPSETEGTPAEVDAVLREILETEVGTHLETVRGWLQRAEQASPTADDALVRAFHTMNGAFAMADVPEITAVTGAAEGYLKRLLAAGETVPEAAVTAVADGEQAIRRTLAALQAESPRIPAFNELAERLSALRDSLPPPPSPAMIVMDGDAARETYAEDLPAIQPPQALDDEGALEFEVEVETDDEIVLSDADETFADDEDAIIIDDETIVASGMEDESPAPVASDYFNIDLTYVPLARTPLAEATAEGIVNGLTTNDAGGEAPVEVEAPAETEAVTDIDVPTEAVDVETPAEATAEIAEEVAEEIAEESAVAIDEIPVAEASATEPEVVEDADTGIPFEPVVEAMAESDETSESMIPDEVVLEEQIPEAPVPQAPPADEVVELEAGVEDIAVETPDDAAAEAEAVEAPFEPEVEAEPVQEPVEAPAEEPVVAEVETAAMAGEQESQPSASDYDPELVEIFIEEGRDLLDHSDGLLARLRETPTDLALIGGLQRDLHTLKGGARMAGLMEAGDLGHAIESLLEQAAGQRIELGADDIGLLERGFDRLHAMLADAEAQRAMELPEALIAEVVARAQGTSTGTAAGTAASDEAAATAVVELAPLSAPVEVEFTQVEELFAANPQEQVRVRAELLDRLVNHAGEVAIYRSRLEQQMGAFRGAMAELDRTNTRLHDQLRRLDLETEAQIVARYQREQDQRDPAFDPLELDRFSTLQQLSRALAESAADLTGLQGVLDDLSRQYDSLLQQQSRVSSELQDGLMRARMVPFESLVPRLRRVVRQAARDTGKQARLELEGTHGELDRNVLERMVAPLEHLLRNAIAHGLEQPRARRKVGKGDEGTVKIALRREGSEMVLQVSDDGAGIDHAAIRNQALRRGLIAKDASLSDGELERLILEPGFSTSEKVSQLAGRGVGMDVVYSEVRQLGGSLDIDSVAGKGTAFTLRLPQTLAVTQAVFVQIGETQFAVPVAAVGGIGRIARERFEAEGGSYVYGGEEYALHDLGALVGQVPAKAEGQPQIPLLLVRAGDLRAAVAVDQVLGNREIVVKPVGPQIASIPGIYGATITGDGQVVVILDAAPLVRRYISNPSLPEDTTPAPEQRRVPLVMVVDDSLTMRKVTGRVLERHNLEVVAARDGVEALEKLEEHIPDLMLLDIEMPRMDGYELATAMRADPRYRDVPIVMITSRSGEKHRQRAFEIGVQRYMGKPYQELDLMRNVYDLLGIARVRE
ncbi:hybrid sensor histidine kinase/response regulator [Pseudoxanthomonas kalamensis DSM 18571]|nr:Hpt domain-containing protein [Pseudoxanthomonas kalamensis]KAF1709313.1 hybrid sensor histidine kinase/response regulator [Pseudoxanthomonas kalamensis DSM 18571]